MRPREKKSQSIRREAGKLLIFGPLLLSERRLSGSADLSISQFWRARMIGGYGMAFQRLARAAMARRGPLAAND